MSSSRVVRWLESVKSVEIMSWRRCVSSSRAAFKASVTPSAANETSGAAWIESSGGAQPMMEHLTRAFVTQGLPTDCSQPLARVATSTAPALAAISTSRPQIMWVPMVSTRRETVVPCTLSQQKNLRVPPIFLEAIGPYSPKYCCSKFLTFFSALETRSALAFGVSRSVIPNDIPEIHA